MPWGRLPRARLLDQHVVVVEPHPRAAHQPAGDLGCRRAADERAVLLDLLPVAEVLDEAAAIVVPAGDDRARAGGGEVALDALLDHGDLLRRERAAHADGPVAAKVLDLLGGDGHRVECRRT